ncbi:hypothetical protein [Paenibacillus faecalis]|uniref:hypothetical protein n=1 Tax=Paenibacillus faecalis TaxID=2079532 RepID=UPI000D10D8D2|nr:hypothetical protein [Paenibacillus faecalis]
MENNDLTLELRELHSRIETELDNYSEEEQAVILNHFLNRLEKKHKTNQIMDIKEVWRPPYLWLLVAGGIAFPVLLYIIFVWTSLLLET